MKRYDSVALRVDSVVLRIDSCQQMCDHVFLRIGTVKCCRAIR